MKPWANQMGPSSITLIGKEQLLVLAPDLEWRYLQTSTDSDFS